jgi:hypothetical protein
MRQNNSARAFPTHVDAPSDGNRHVPRMVEQKAAVKSVRPTAFLSSSALYLPVPNAHASQALSPRPSPWEQPP